MTLNDLEAYRASIVGQKNQELTITLTPTERAVIITLVEPTAAAKQKQIDHARKQNHITAKARAALIRDIDTLMSYLTLLKKLKGDEGPGNNG
jgi:hypothetical protein